MTSPVAVECSSSCTVTVVHELTFPPFQLTAAEGKEIAFSIVAIWAVAFVIRLIIRMVLEKDGVSQTGEN